ncbi:hypothetical protein BC829DRAFT_382929, partial [Chytridium lagenaria]
DRERDRDSRSDRDRSERDGHRDRDRERRRHRSSRSRSPRRRSKSREKRRRHSRSPTQRTVPLHLRPRKLNHWDMPPPGYEGLTADQVKATGHFPLPDTSMSQPSSIARQARRLYVGNIPFGINEVFSERHYIETLITFFNQTMIASLSMGSPGNLLLLMHRLIMRKTMRLLRFFRTPEESSQAMSLDGLTYQGQVLKIRRPKDYQAPVGNSAAANVALLGMVSTNVPDSPHKLFVGGLPSYLNDVQVMELLTSFGELRAFNLVKDGSTGLSKGYAFCEYANAAITDIACQGLNGMELGDKKLIVQRASIGATKPAITAYAPAALPTTFLSLNSANMEPTNILMLLNMVSPDELIQEDEYNDIVDDIREECSKYGEIDVICIPRPQEGVENPHVGKDGATAALRALAGRQFAARTVFTSYVDLEDFEAVRRLSGNE